MAGFKEIKLIDKFAEEKLMEDARDIKTEMN